MPKCPKCGVANEKEAGGWTGGAKTRSPMKVSKYVCSSCGTSFVAWTDAKTKETRVMARKVSR